ncbi:MAG: aminotransferase class IV [Cryobacterium sp.]|nr:aminotransferase class IV [Oligoflexia bacterium]
METASKNIVLNVNGEFIADPFAPSISAFDRSYLYGDSLYEVVRTYGGRFLYLEEHLVRLAKSADLCKMKLSKPLSFYAQECEKSLNAFNTLNAPKLTEAYCRLVISRGTGKIGFGTENILSGPTFAVIVQPLNPPTPEQWEAGYRYGVVDRWRNEKRALDPAAKTGNYLNSLLAYLEATNDGYQDALLCDSAGFLTEGTTFNLFYVKRDIIVTPPFSSGILDGITRRTVIQIARRMGLEVREVPFPKERLYDAAEIFMTSTIKEVAPVVEIDGRKIANGKPGKITRRLKNAFTEYSLARSEKEKKS